MQPPVRRIEDDEWLTQVGSRRRNGTFSFHDVPRAFRHPPERSLSWVVGELSPQAARIAAFGPDTTLRPETDAVRYARVSDLRSAGFVVDHDPKPLNPLHVLVAWGGEGEWDDKVGALLHACCSEGRCHG